MMSAKMIEINCWRLHRYPKHLQDLLDGDSIQEQTKQDLISAFAGTEGLTWRQAVDKAGRRMRGYDNLESRYFGMYLTFPGLRPRYNVERN